MNLLLSDMMRQFAREELGVYCTVQNPSFILAQHVKLVVSALEDVEAGRCKRLVLSMPPRHGKSMTCSQLFPAWYLGRHPNHYFIETSYGEELATDFGRQVRNHINSPQHKEIFPDCKLADDASAAHRFFIDGKGGQFYAVGRGGAITGRGAHILLVDDPTKDDQEASSEIERDKLHVWYQAVARTRLMPDAAIVIVTTRWHVDDLPGWVLENHKNEQWRVISMAALAEKDDDLLGRQEGEALWPSQFSQEYLENTRDGMEARLWDALYQQKPSIGGGYTFAGDQMEYYDTPHNGRGMNVYILVDPANSKRKTSDMTAMWVVGLAADSNYYILDMVHDRLTVDQRGDKLIKLHKKHRPLGVAYEKVGMQTDHDYIKQQMDKLNYHFTITDVFSNLPKRNRIESLQPIFRKHRFWFPHELDCVTMDGRRHELVREFKEQELVKYPAVKHEDRLDALAWIAQPQFPVVWPELEDEDDGTTTQQIERWTRYGHRRRRKGTVWAA